MAEIPYEVFVVVDTAKKEQPESVVAIFTDMGELLRFSSVASLFFQSGRFIIQAGVPVNPIAHSNISIYRKEVEN